MAERSEHLEWCKQRANGYVEHGDLTGAFTSFQSDMSKRSETENHLALEIGMSLLLSNNLSTKQQMKEWIDGFN